MSTPAPPKMGRIKQFTETYRIASQTDKRLGLYTLLAFLVGAAVGAGLLWLLPPNDGGVIKIILTVVGGLLFGAMAALLLFSRRAQKAAYAQMEGRPGAAIAALSTLKRGWHTDKLVAFNKQQDMVHRVVGRPGIVLIGEGNPNRLRTMLANERRKHERVAADVPVHEVIVGNDEGQVPLPKLTRSVQSLPKAVKPAEMTDILARLKALDATRSTIPMPKGPVPTSMKGLRGNMRGR